MPDQAELTASYMRPVPAHLAVVLDNGETFPATEDDLNRFGCVRRLDIYTRAEQLLCEALEIDSFDDVDSGHVAHDVRYLIECAIMYDHRPWEDSDCQPSPDSQTAKERLQSALRIDPSN